MRDIRSPADCEELIRSLLTLAHGPCMNPSRVFSGAIEFCGPRITILLQPAHFVRIFLKFPNKLQEPHVTDTKFSGPGAAGGLAVVAACCREHQTPGCPVRVYLRGP